MMTWANYQTNYDLLPDGDGSSLKNTEIPDTRKGNGKYRNNNKDIAKPKQKPPSGGFIFPRKPMPVIGS